MYLPITFLETYISTKINKLLSTYTPYALQKQIGLSWKIFILEYLFLKSEHTLKMNINMHESAIILQS